MIDKVLRKVIQDMSKVLVIDTVGNYKIVEASNETLPKMQVEHYHYFTINNVEFGPEIFAEFDVNVNNGK